MPLIQVNLGEQSPEMYNSYSALTVAPIPPLIILLHSVCTISSITQVLSANQSHPCPQPPAMFSWTYLSVWLPQPLK